MEIDELVGLTYPRWARNRVLRRHAAATAGRDRDSAVRSSSGGRRVHSGNRPTCQTVPHPGRDTFDEAIRMIRDAVELTIEDMSADELATQLHPTPAFVPFDVQLSA